MSSKAKKVVAEVKEKVVKAVKSVQSKKIDNHDLKPRSVSKEYEIQASIKTPTVTLISPHGKEVTIAKSMVAFHLEKGFTIKE